MANKGNIPWNKGKQWPSSIKKKISKAKIGKNIGIYTGENSFNWKGEKAKYHPIHLWIRRHWGQPQFCEFCGIIKVPNKFKKRERDHFNWARKHGTSSRERTDWLRLCRPCHIKYDIKRKIKDKSIC